MIKKYMLLLPYGWVETYMYRDLLANDNVHIFYMDKPLENKIVNFLRRVHRSNKINKIIDLPGKSLWDSELLQKTDNTTCVIFTTGTLEKRELSFLRNIKKRAAKIALLITDSMRAHSWHLEMVKHKIFNFEWDLILSFDQYDCEKYGFHFLGKNYYSILGDVACSNIKSDIYYVGSEKRNSNRNQKIVGLHRFFANNNIICNFNIVDNKRNSEKYKDFLKNGLKLSFEWIPYEKVLSEVKSTNCILEMLQEGQNEQSLRYFEAVCYNKKLLTNNERIQYLPFYNEKYMRYFKTLEDIDLEWIKTKEIIDYGYKNEFSPVKILEIVNEYFDN